MLLITNLSSATGPTDPNLLGSKGANLKQMARLGLPIPPGFILTTHVWQLFDQKGILPTGVITQVQHALKQLEKETGQIFGSSTKPLLVSVRSGAKHSMPGMMDTILNVGVSENSLLGLASMMGNESFAWDVYRRFIKMFAASVYGIHPGEFDLIDEVANTSLSGRYSLSLIQTLVNAYQKVVFEKAGQKIPQDPKIQLEQSIAAVLNSWYNPGAVAFRQLNGIPDDLGTAVVIQAMVFGNRDNSGTGVLFTRDTQTGHNQFTGDYLTTAQGDDIVRGTTRRRTEKISQFAAKHPSWAKKLFRYAKLLEKEHHDVQDIEFTIEDGQLWLLQTRSARRSPLANIRIARDLLKERTISKEVALRRVKPSDIDHLCSPGFQPKAEKKAKEEKLFAKGISASPGVMVGAAAITPADVKKLTAARRPVIWVNDHIDPNDVNSLMRVNGIITTKGSASSHMALIMRSAGLPGIVGCARIRVNQTGQFITNDLHTLRIGEYLSMDATHGNVYLGKLPRQTSCEIPKDVRAFVDKRIQMFGRSPWSAALYTEKPTVRLAPLLETVHQLNQQARNHWRSQKARTIELINQVFPPKLLITSKLIRPRQIAPLRKALQQVIKAGHTNAPRTCHYPEKLAGAPWANGPNTKNQLEKFLIDAKYPGKYGGYPRWIEDPTLNAIIVSQEPKGKLNPRLAAKHFVCTVSCLSTQPPSIVVNINFGTSHLRSLERVTGTSLVMIKAILNPQAEYELGNITYQIGEEYFNDQQLRQLVKALRTKTQRRRNHTDPLSAPARHLAKQVTLLFPEIDLQLVSLSSLRRILTDLMARNALPANVYQHIVEPSFMNLLGQISERIFKDWWQPPLALPYLMTALDEVVGLSVVESQGRFEKGKLVWFRIYGAKGAEEKEKISTWQNTKQSS